jgi:hypothetical protein
MGRVKDSIPDYVFDYNISIDKYALEHELSELIEEGIFEDKTLLREFLENIVPYTGDQHYIYVIDDAGIFSNIRYNREEYIDALCCLSQYELTLFLHPSSFSGWITEKNTRAARCLYVDIDDIGMYADVTDKETAVNFIKDVYGLTDEQMPQYLSLSGRGIHLIYLIDDMYFWDTSKIIKKKRKKCEPVEKEPCPFRCNCPNSEMCTNSDVCINRDIYKRYNASLISSFDADFTGNNISHMYRCPTSYNVKERPIKGKLFRINNSDSRDIHRLDWALKTDEEIVQYRRSYYSRRNEKGLITKERNLKRKQEFLNSLNGLTLEEFIKLDNISIEDRELAKKLLRKQNKPKKNSNNSKVINPDKNTPEIDIDDLFENTALPYKHLRYYDNYKPENRTWNLLLDLHNFFIRHEGLLASRNMFFFIIANYLRCMGHPDYYAIKYCDRYCDRAYRNEMINTIKATYHNETKYQFTYGYIALALGFSDEDIELSYCNFSAERKKEAKRKNNKLQYDRLLERTGKQRCKDKKACQLEYLKDNPETDEKAAMFILGIGRTTYYNLKKELRNAAIA